MFTEVARLFTCQSKCLIHVNLAAVLTLAPCQLTGSSLAAPWQQLRLQLPGDLPSGDSKVSGRQPGVPGAKEILWRIFRSKGTPQDEFQGPRSFTWGCLGANELLKKIFWCKKAPQGVFRSQRAPQKELQEARGSREINDVPRISFIRWI